MFEKLTEKERETLRREHQKGMIDNALSFFPEQMKEEMLKHLDRPGWKREPWEYLFERLLEEAKELKNALESFHDYKFSLVHLEGNEEEYFKLKKKIVKECADVANFAMMIADNFF